MHGGVIGRQLGRYPDNGLRTMYLGIVVLATVILYYQLYVQGSVATQLVSDLDMSLAYFITISVVGNAVGALASILAGLADRWGRANLVVYGLLVTSLLVLFGLPNASSKLEYLIFFTLVSVVEGVILVATPALIRDFSPQLGRASAMGFWTLGPVLGSLVVTSIASNTLDSHPDWQFQFRVCGIVSLVVFVIAFIGLRELAPQLRDQLMVSLRERELIEARARDIDVDAAVKGHWRQMVRVDIVGPAFAIAVFLLFYYIAVGFFVVFFATTFGYSESRANALANWYWIGNAITLVVTGLASDRLKVRKPFMVAGAVISGVGVALFALATTESTTSYYHFAGIILLIAIGGGMAFAAWMAAFTETVEKHNPAATATGLAVWGSVLRVVVTCALVGLIFAIPAAGTLVDKGTPLQALADKYAAPLATLQKLDPATQKALGANPNDQLTQASAVGQIAGVPTTDVVKTVTLSTQYAQQLATAQAVDPVTLATLSGNPTNASAGARAVAQIAQKLAISPTQAITRLQALATVPKADLAFLQSTGTKVQTAGDQLKAAALIPAGDLSYIQANAAEVQKAQQDVPGQWQRWWWLCFLGQLVFLPFIWLLTGRWSPAAARRDAAEHEAAVQRELTRV
ncbi:hypothetical protein GCM10009619_05430 [Williamsia maris]|uniref:Major Facilitator Superfamily protein n=1 Tax=Williamsia maris TaxID=72806 RepID=A0ABT1H931_9NOCA|nr:Major Facilitator Superfamily protein [Williamsia maris]